MNLKQNDVEKKDREPKKTNTVKQEEWRAKI